jgi:hypothetical protein
MRVMALVMGGTEKSTKETMEKVKINDAADVYDPWTTKFGDLPSYKTAAEAEMAGTPSFGSSEQATARTRGTGLPAWGSCLANRNICQNRQGLGQFLMCRQKARSM